MWNYDVKQNLGKPKTKCSLQIMDIYNYSSRAVFNITEFSKSQNRNSTNTKYKISTNYKSLTPTDRFEHS